MTTADRVTTRGRSLYNPEGSARSCAPGVRHPSPFHERERVAYVSTEIVSNRRDPVIRATPAEGCDVCGALAKAWAEAEDRDLLIEINNHPHAKPQLSRVHKWVAEGANVG